MNIRRPRHLFSTVGARRRLNRKSRARRSAPAAETLERRYVLDSAVVFNEIMFAPAEDDQSLEWIELHNPMSIDADISAWRLDGGVEFTFDEGTIVPGGGYLVIAKDPASLADSGLFFDAIGPYSGQLANGGEQLELYDRNRRLMDELDYDDQGKFPIAPDGSGASLAKLDEDRATGSPDNWSSSILVGGTPGQQNFPEDSLSRTSTILTPFRTTWRYDAGDVFPGSDWMTPEFNDQAWSEGQSVLYSGDVQQNDDVVQLERVSVTASSQLAGFDRVAGYTVDGSGLSNNAHSITPDGTMWLSQGTFNGVRDPHIAAGDGLLGHITFDLGTQVRLDNMKVWNYNEMLPGRPELLSRGIERADILVAGEDQAFTMFSANHFFNKAAGTQTDFSQVIDFGGAEIRYVRLDIRSHQPGGDNSFVGLSEVQFFGQESSLGDELPNGASTFYFRREFELDGDPASADLFFQGLFDDGAVVYLNGQEIYRQNMPSGAVAHATLASSSIELPMVSQVIELDNAALRLGENVLAVEVHQALANDPDMLFAAELVAIISPIDISLERAALAINELPAAGDDPVWIEMLNTGANSIDLEGFVLASSAGMQYSFGSQTVAGGDYLVVSEAEFGFGYEVGDRIFLYNPDGSQVVDAVRIEDRLRGRSPDGAGPFLFPDQPTPGAANSFSFHDEIVINEIMYNAPGISGSPGEPPTYAVTELVSFTDTWRYSRDLTSGAATPYDPGPNWDETSHPVDALNWFSGPAPFGFETAGLPIGINTPFANPQTNTSFINSYYFEIEFGLTQQQIDGLDDLGLRYMVDDGAVFYLNGEEIHRFNMQAGITPTASTQAQGSVNNAVISSDVAVATSHLLALPAMNRFSVEVHQSAINSSDVVFAAELASRELVSPGVPPTPYTESGEEWIELYNRGAAAVDLTGWRFSDAIDYAFPAGTTLQPGEYLVVSKDAVEFQAKYPGVPVIGDFRRALDNMTDRLVLGDDQGNPADVVRYYDDGRWPREADGGGASLELRHPDADNAAAEAWAASNELLKSTWDHYEYEGVASGSVVGPDGQWNELVIGLLDRGEVLLDNLSVVQNPAGAAIELAPNGSFEFDTVGQTAGSWRLLGNHSHSQVVLDPDDPNNQVLRFVATGATEHMHNHGETTLTSLIQNGQTYRISFDARWVSGSEQVNTRLYFNRLPATTYVARPSRHGTPGAVNSVWEANAGPTFQDVIHSPAVPEPVEPVTVSLSAADPDGVASLTLWYSVNSGPWQSTAMAEQGGGVYSGTIPPHPAGTIVQFYAEAMDSQGATSTFPRAGADSRALFKVNDGLAATNGLHNLRLILTPDDADRLHTDINLMGNDRVGATVIYDEHDIVYDAGIRLSGSQRARPFTPRLSFNVRFPSEHLFRGVHRTMALDRSESTGFGQQELISHHISNHVGMQPAEYNDLVHIITPRLEHTGSAEAQLARYTDTFLDSQFNNGGAGMLFEYELIYYPTTANGQGYKLPQPDSVRGTAITDLGDFAESYRWNFLIKNNRQRDDYTGLIEWAKVMGLTGQAFDQQIGDVIDVDQWLRAFAFATISGAGDQFGRGDAHNAQFYVRPEDNKVLFFPHDLDAFLNATNPLVGSPVLSKLIQVPERAHMYYGHVQDMLQTTYNTDYMSHFTQNFGDLLPAQNFAGHLNFIATRSSYLQGQINSAAAPIGFALSSPGPLNVGDATTATVTGEGWVNVREIRLAGNPVPLQVRWNTVTGWETTLTVAQGTHPYTLEAYDFQGDLIATRTIDITSSSTDPRLVDALRITEVMYNAPPATAEEQSAGFTNSDEFEFIEIKNVSAETVNLFGARLADGVEFTFGNLTLDPGAFALVVENQAAFEARYGSDLPVAGQWTGALSNNGEIVDLLDPQNLLILSLDYDDSGNWPNRADGNGSSLEVIDTAGDYNDGNNWRSSTEYGGSPGTDGVGEAFDVIVSEVLTHTDPPLLDAIELLNTTDQVLDISGWYLSDDVQNLRKYQIPDGTSIPAGGYLVFDESDFNVSGGVEPNDFALDSARGDDVWLMATDEGGRLVRFADHVDFLPAANGESFGRWPNGAGDLYPMTVVTLGADNSGPRVGPLVISELNYRPLDPDGEGGIDPGDLEFVEIHNPTQTTVELTNWQLTGAVDYEFPVGTSIGPQEFVVVIRFNPTNPANADRLANFQTVYGLDAGVNLVGGFSGQLSNGGERLRLRRPDEPPQDAPDLIPLLLEDEVDYQDQPPWPGADGTGLSLTRLAVDAWGNDPQSWLAAPPTPGTIDTSAPRVLDLQVNSGLLDPDDLPAGPSPSTWATQRSELRSILVTFSRPIIVSASDLVLTNLGVNSPQDEDNDVDLVDSQLSVVRNTLLLSFARGDLQDGVYRLTILPTVTDSQDNPLDGDGDGTGGDAYQISGSAVNKFFQATGDWNADGGVTIFDFPTFAYWFGKAFPESPEYVDLNGDLGVTIFDFPTFAQNFGKGLIYPSPIAGELLVSDAVGDGDNAQIFVGLAARRDAFAGDLKRGDLVRREPSNREEAPLPSRSLEANLFWSALAARRRGESVFPADDSEDPDLEQVLGEIGKDVALAHVGQSLRD